MIEFVKKLKKRVKQGFLKRKTQELKSKGAMIKLVIGAGRTHYEGWLMTDMLVLDALNPSDWKSIFPPNSIHRVLAEHVVEHWTEEAFCDFLQIVTPFLAEQGFIRIAVPDGFHPDPAYVDYVRPGGSGAGAADHKVLYNYLTMTQLLSKVQYEHQLLECFDETGQFHQAAWDVGDGFVHRSANYDSRNKKHPLTYTSLILDAWPKTQK